MLTGASMSFALHPDGARLAMLVVFMSNFFAYLKKIAPR